LRALRHYDDDRGVVEALRKAVDDHDTLVPAEANVVSPAPY
jgi:hypothetical protein